MEKEKTHSTGYTGYIKITIILLILSALSIVLAGQGHSAFISGIIIGIATIQGIITLIWLMHLNLDNWLMRIFVGGVFILFIIVLVITFFDYWFR
jgi:cytochrome c oxidase subunit 4